MIGTLLGILGSLGMFIFGMKVMSESLQKLSGERLRAMMRTMTHNRVAALGTGFLITCLVQSSSATTVMIVSFVNASLLTLTEAIGMILGANLGTTTTFWIVSYFGFKFSVSSIALPIIGIGFPMIFIKKGNIRHIGEFLIGFGLLFLGLLFLKDSVPDIRNNPDALEFIQNFTGRGVFSVLAFFVFGTLLTVVVQSSSVAGAITITMAYKGWIDFPSAAAIILGENVGTTITANLAALAGNTAAKRAALAHFFFNIIGVIWAIILFGPLVSLVDAIMPGPAADAANIPMHMALFHSGFNFLNICLVIGFVPMLARFVDRFYRQRAAPKAEHMIFQSSTVPQTGELNFAEAEKDIQEMGKLTRQILEGFVDLFENPGPDAPERAEGFKQLEVASDRMAFEITDYLLKCSAGSLSNATLSRVSSHLRVVAELEDICDCGYRLVLLAERKSRKGRDLPENTLTEIREFSALLFRFMEFWSGFLGRDVTAGDMDTAFQLEKQIDQARKKLRRESMLRMQSSGEAIKAEMLYIDILNNMESIGNHSLNILQALRHAD
jgi:phosphate:Na+ symporter